MHAHYSVHLSIWLSEVCSHERHPIERHGAGKHHHVSSCIHDSEVISQMAPGNMHKRELILSVRHLYWSVLSQVPFARGFIS